MFTPFFDSRLLICMLIHAAVYHGAPTLWQAMGPTLSQSASVLCAFLFDSVLSLSFLERGRGGALAHLFFLSIRCTILTEFKVKL